MLNWPILFQWLTNYYSRVICGIVNSFLLPRVINTCNTVGVETIAESIMWLVKLIYTICALTKQTIYWKLKLLKTQQSQNDSFPNWFTWDTWSEILAYAITIVTGASTSDINSQHADVVLLLCAALSQSCGFAWFDSSDYLRVVGWGSTRIYRLSCAILMESHARLQDDRATPGIHKKSVET